MVTTKEQKRFILLLLIMVIVSICVGGSAIYVLYNAAFEQQRERLMDTVHSQARLIEAIARYDNNAASTLNQIIDAHNRNKGFGKTGEFTLAKQEGNKIVWLLSHRHNNRHIPQATPLDSTLAEPMRRALTTKKSGTIVGPDYRGVTVLAAYEAIQKLHYGIVVKIDLAEIHEPFVKAGIIATITALIFVALGAFLFFRISEPILMALKKNNKQLYLEIEERKQVEKQLTASLEEKNILLKEIHHRVKNNMAMVASFLQFQILDTNNPKDRARFIDTQNRIYTMALIHEKLYQTENFSKINFDNFIQEISESIRSSCLVDSCNVELTLQTNNISMDLNKAIPCGLIINELMSNALSMLFQRENKAE
ncbi:MAG: hypothetical protein D3923_03795 [Candidatus Electrothrix sp. AR3]|nr:hypothetical protein [Candidatus Electrothrix sp. AR3]